MKIYIMEDKTGRINAVPSAKQFVGLIIQLADLEFWFISDGPSYISLPSQPSQMTGRKKKKSPRWGISSLTFNIFIWDENGRGRGRGSNRGAVERTAAFSYCDGRDMPHVQSLSGVRYAGGEVMREKMVIGLGFFCGSPHCVPIWWSPGFSRPPFSRKRAHPSTTWAQLYLIHSCYIKCITFLPSLLDFSFSCSYRLNLSSSSSTSGNNDEQEPPDINFQPSHSPIRAPDARPHKLPWRPLY